MGGIRLAVIAVVSSGCHLVFPIDPGDDGGMPIGDAPGEAPDARAQAYLFSDGFETGISPPWTVVLEPDDAVSAIADPVHAGAAAAHFQTDTLADGQAMVHYTPPAPLDTAYVRFYLRLDPAYRATSWVGVAALAREVATDWQNLIVVTLEADRTLYIENTAGGQYHYSSVKTQLVPGTWYRIDLGVTISAVSGSIALAIDGQPEIVVPQVNTGILLIDRFAFGIIWQGVTNEGVAVQIDDVDIDPAPL